MEERTVDFKFSMLARSPLRCYKSTLPSKGSPSKVLNWRGRKGMIPSRALIGSPGGGSVSLLTRYVSCHPMY